MPPARRIRSSKKARSCELVLAQLPDAKASMALAIVAGRDVPPSKLQRVLDPRRLHRNGGARHCWNEPAIGLVELPPVGRSASRRAGHQSAGPSCPKPRDLGRPDSSIARVSSRAPALASVEPSDRSRRTTLVARSSLFDDDSGSQASTSDFRKRARIVEAELPCPIASASKPSVLDESGNSLIAPASRVARQNEQPGLERGRRWCNASIEECDEHRLRDSAARPRLGSRSGGAARRIGRCCRTT